MRTVTATADSKKERPRISYGWVVVGSSLMMYTVIGAVQYSFGVFFKPLQTDLGWSRTTTSLAMTIYLVVFALCMLPVGFLIDRVRLRILFSFAAFVTGISLILSSRIMQPWQLYLLYGVPLGIGSSICGPVLLTVVTRWFSKRRGLALGITATGIGFGTLVGAPVSNMLIVNYGWRDALVVLGIACFILLMICAFFIKAAPKHTSPQSEPAASVGNVSRKKPAVTPGLSLRQALRTRELFLILLAAGFDGFVLRIVMVHIVPHATDIGIEASVAALAMGIIGAGSIIGRLSMGYAQDKIGSQRSMIICLGVQAASMLVLPFIHSEFLFLIYAAVYGFVYGGDIPQLPAMTAQCFGMSSVSLIYGLVQALKGLTGALGPAVAGYMFDTTGSYTVVFLAGGVGLILGVLALWQVKLDRYMKPAPQD